MKATIAATLAACIASGAAYASPESAADNVCLKQGKLAAVVGDARTSGYDEKTVAEMMQRIPAGPPAAQKRLAYSSKAIVEFVYTMGLNAEDARRTVYLKCKAGEFALPTAQARR